MTAKALFFKSYEPAIRYHISRRLLKEGWHTVTAPHLAAFSDVNLSINDEISILLEYKHLLAFLIQRFCYDIAPPTYALDDENYRNVLENLYYHKQAKKPWILKPALLNNGDDIHLFADMKGVINHYLQDRRLGGPHVVQRYIDKPDLIDGKKYTFRIPGVLTNYDGVYLHEHGYANISAVPYESEIEGVDRKTHITNYILDGKLAGITQLSTKDIPGFDKLYPKLCKLLKHLFKALTAVYPHYLEKQPRKAFEIFGFDFMLDHKRRPYLLEINQGPDFPMTKDHPLDKTLWDPFWQSIIDEFVEPVALGQEKPQRSNFTQIMTYQKATHPSKLALRKGKRFLEAFEDIIYIQA